MGGLAVFGLFGFVMAVAAMSRVKRLERILRENKIRSAGAAALGGQLRDRIGGVVSLSVEDSDADIVGKTCRVLDVDEEWALLRVNEGKKNEGEKLIRLDSVKQVKDSAGTKG